MPGDGVNKRPSADPTFHSRCDTMDMRVDLHNLHIIASSINDNKDLLRDEVFGALSLVPSFTTKMIENRMEGVLQKHTAQIESTTTALLDDQNARLDPLIRRPPRLRRQQIQSPTSPTSKASPRKKTNPQANGLAINVNQYASVCPSTCVCACHTRCKAPASAFVNRVLGHLFVGAAGIPFLSTKCDFHACASSRAPRVTVEYWFPMGVFWSQILRLQVAYQANLGPQFSLLRSLRRVPDSSPCVYYAMHGNIAGLKDLFRRGQASPWDVSSTRGYTLSRASHEIFRPAQSSNHADTDPVGPLFKTVQDRQVFNLGWF